MYFVITFVLNTAQLIWLYPEAIFPGYSSETNDDLFSGCYLSAYRCDLRRNLICLYSDHLVIRHKKLITVTK